MLLLFNPQKSHRRADDRLQRYEEINDIQNKMRNKWIKSLYFGGGKNKMYMNFAFSGVIY